MYMNAKSILQVRNKLNLTQAQFGQLLGSHPMTVSKWERGELMPSDYQTALIQQFFAAAKEKEVQENLKALLIGAGVVAALFLLLKSAK